MATPGSNAESVPTTPTMTPKRGEVAPRSARVTRATKGGGRSDREGATERTPVVVMKTDDDATENDTMTETKRAAVASYAEAAGGGTATDQTPRAEQLLREGDALQQALDESKRSAIDSERLEAETDEAVERWVRAQRMVRGRQTPDGNCMAASLTLLQHRTDDAHMIGAVRQKIYERV